MKLKVLAAALAAFGSMSAFAVGPGSLGNIDNSTFPIGNTVSGMVFVDDYMFSLSGLTDLIGFTSDIGIGNFGVVLKMGATTIGSDATADAFSFSGLTGGSYTLSYVGFPTSSSAAYGGVLSTVSVVPEPETYALMLAGLGVMGFVATRRRSQR